MTKGLLKRQIGINSFEDARKNAEYFQDPEPPVKEESESEESVTFIPIQLDRIQFVIRVINHYDGIHDYKVIQCHVQNREVLEGEEERRQSLLHQESIQWDSFQRIREKMISTIRWMGVLG